MKKVHISKIYQCDTLSIACELYYVCELGKYLFYNYDTALSLKDVHFSRVLTKSEIWVYFCIAIDNGWVVDADFPQERLIDLETLEVKDWKHYSTLLKNVLYVTKVVEYNAIDVKNRRRRDTWVDDKNRTMCNFRYDLTIPKQLPIVFSDVSTHNRWVFALEGKYANDSAVNTINNTSINGELPQFSWLSLIAYVAVEKYSNYQTSLLPLSLYLYFNNTLALNETSLAYFLILYDKSQCFTGWVHFSWDASIDERLKNHLMYVAWYKLGLDKGLLASQEWYDGETKRAMLEKMGIEVKDVVFLYERNDLQRRNHIKEVSDVHIAVIDRITDRNITLNVILTTQLRSDARCDFKVLDEKIQALYATPPYKNLRHKEVTFEWFEIGVHYAMVDEKYFIMPLEESTGRKVQRVSNGYETLRISLGQADFIYWLLEEYHVDYNRERFLNKYFKEYIPLYQSYIVEHQPMESCYII